MSLSMNNHQFVGLAEMGSNNGLDEDDGAGFL